ncbi:MAG: tetratricopeptide repeat protein, partial [Verrucomicrobiota bacterium]|nr:tetratricopeptide repeat protein [Verrucomicrobiota bacterium]
MMWNMLSTAALAALVPAVAAETNPDDPKAVAVEKEFRELLKLDDRLHAEVDRWIRDNAALAEANAAISRESLGEQVRIRLRKVEEAYVSFVAKHPKHIEARLAFGGYYSGIGDADKAIGQWVEARDLNPKNPVPWNNLGKAYGQKG